MRAFNITSRSLVTNNPSYENAIAAGSLSHTGNSFSPIGSVVKNIAAPVARIVQPVSYPVPRATPQRPVSRINEGGPSLSVPVAHPVLHTPSIRGIIGQ